MLLKRPYVKSDFFLGHRILLQGFQTTYPSQTLLWSEVGAHSIFLQAQLEEVTPGLSTWLRTRDLTHIYRGMGFNFPPHHKRIWINSLEEPVRQFGINVLYSCGSFHTTWNNQIFSWPGRVCSLLDVLLEGRKQSVSPCSAAYFTLLCCMFNKTETDISVSPSSF